MIIDDKESKILNLLINLSSLGAGVFEIVEI
jgi:hypothetical protein